MRSIYLCTVMLTFTIGLQAQKIDQYISMRDMGDAPAFRFSYDNDFFASSDRNYTQGYSFEWTSPVLAKNPVAFLLLKKQSVEQRHGLVLEHIGFTPRDIVSTEIQRGDRPFASAIMLKSYVSSIDHSSRTRLSSALTLGVMGPVAFGEWMQVSIHRALDNRIPGGWPNQIRNDIILGYEVAHEKEWLRLRDILALRSDVAASIGTLSSKAHVGAQVQVGLLGPYDGVETKRWRIFSYARPLISFIEYDASLQGGKFNRDSPYTIQASDIERIVGSAELGIIVHGPSLYVEFYQAMLSHEFKGGEAASYGGFKLGWKW